LAGVLPAASRLRGEEAAGCGDSASRTEPDATTHRRTHRTLCSRQAGKCQHRDLQLLAREHRDRFKNGAHHFSLQDNERRKMRPGRSRNRSSSDAPAIPTSTPRRHSTASFHATVRRSRLLLCASITARMVRSACSGVTSSAAFFSIASRTLA
jgi:hypothetical protein